MIVSRSYRLKIALLCLFAVTCFMSSAAHCAEKISDKIDVEVSALRKARARDQFQVDVTLKNKSDAAISGTVVLVVKGTSVRGLVLTEPDGHLPGGMAYLKVIAAKESLKAGEEKSLKAVSFDASPLLKSDDLEKFDLQTDVYRIDEQSKTADSRTQNPTLGASGLPSTRSGAGGSNSGAGNATADRPTPPLEPMPDPVFAGNTEDPGTNDEGDNRGHTTKRPRVPTEEEVAAVVKIQNNWNERILEIEGVHTIGTGWGKNGNAVIYVQVEEFSQKKLVPATLNGTPVEVFVAEPAKALQFGRLPDDYDVGNRARGGIWTNVPGCFDDPTNFFPRPTPIGVSGWNAALQLCATGTLGCRLEDPSGNLYILSNSHVLADFGLRSFAGQATLGDPVIQPGPIDLNCAIASDSTVGALVAFSTRSLTMDNFHDAAIAITTPLHYSTATPCDGYGMPRELTIPAVVGMEVMKYGRTTKFTVGDVIALNVTADVGFSSGTWRYVGLILINSNFAFGPYIAAGDSGSMAVSRNGRFPVGLNFAGSAFQGLAIPMDTVLQAMSFQAGIFPDVLTVDGEPFVFPVP